MRANVYVDGFNLYYGALRATPYKWLDIAAPSGLLLKGDIVNRIRYFTAPVQAEPGDPDKPTRQGLYLRALRTIPNLTIHYGHYLSHPVRMALANPIRGQSRTVEVMKTEEKGSDVNIASFLLLDAFDSDCELEVVISNDSDLLLPIQTVRRRFGLRVGVLNPQQKPSAARQREVDFFRPIRQGPISGSQFPVRLTDGRGTFSKPRGW